MFHYRCHIKTSKKKDKKTKYENLLFYRNTTDINPQMKLSAEGGQAKSVVVNAAGSKPWKFTQKSRFIPVSPIYFKQIFVLFSVV
jgi:hypothetical protein